MRRKGRRKMPVKVIGAGLAGCEAAWQIAQAGVQAELVECKPLEMPPAHHSPDFAELVARDVAGGAAERGVLVCGTGIGMAVAANKIDGIRAANVTSPLFAALAREHNDANVVTLSGRFVDEGTNRAILDAFLATPFGEGRHAGRVAKIMALEAK